MYTIKFWQLFIYLLWQVTTIIKIWKLTNYYISQNCWTHTAGVLVPYLIDRTSTSDTKRRVSTKIKHNTYQHIWTCTRGSVCTVTRWRWKRGNWPSPVINNRAVKQKDTFFIDTVFNSHAEYNLEIPPFS